MYVCKKGAPKAYFLFPGFIDSFSSTKMGGEVFSSVLSRGPGLGSYRCTLLRKIMSQYLKLMAPKHDVLPATIDGMYDHPEGQVAKLVYDRQGRNALAPLLKEAYGELW